MEEKRGREWVCGTEGMLEEKPREKVKEQTYTDVDRHVIMQIQEK